MADLFGSTVGILFVSHAEEGIIDGADIGQATIVQLDVVVCTDKDAAAVQARLVKEVLQVDIIALLLAVADFDPAEVAEVIRLG